MAGATIPAAGKLDWAKIFEDIEDTFSLNRFGWLLTAIHASPTADLAERSLEWISDWIDTMGQRRDHPAWESYSVSERLSNWPFILAVSNGLGRLPGDIAQKALSSIRDHIRHLMRNLELRGRYTNNHILNNARGLYIGGLAAGDGSAVEEAKALFYTWIPRLVDESGMLDEDSSHYQFLICQRFEQVCLLCSIAGDDSFGSFMRKWFQAAKRARDLFCVRSPRGGALSMPLIGDISPDYSPEWTLPEKGRGWEKIRGRYAWKDLHCDNENDGPGRGLRLINDRFARYDGNGVTAFWHLPIGPVRAGSHGHFDAGAFTLFHAGTEIFTDPGRRSYDRMGSAFVYARSHGGVMIDGLGPFCEDHRLNLVSAYPYQTANASISDEVAGEYLLSVRVDGFRRLSSPVLWTRSFRFRDNGMTIRDDFQARGDHRVETRFVIPGNLGVSQTEERLRIVSENGTVTLRVGGDDIASDKVCSIEAAHMSRRYGQSMPAAAFVVRQFIKGNHSDIYDIRWNL